MASKSKLIAEFIAADGTVDVANTDITGTLVTTQISDSAVTTAKLAPGSVSSAKLDATYLTPTGDGSGLSGIAGGFSNMQVFTSPGTWTNPGSVTKVKVTVVGGGGGASTNGFNGGGGGGGTAIEVISFPSGTNVPVTVGPGGTGSTGSPGNAGGTSSFGAYCSASGGGAGGRQTSPFCAVAGPGGAGSGGGINITGQGGMSASQGPFPSNTANLGGVGGSSTHGGGGRGSSQDGAQPGGLYGGGAGGGTSYSNTTGTGGSGVVIVEY